jgi:hypothetical protein
MKLTDGIQAAGGAIKDADLVRSLRARAQWQWVKASLREKDLKPGTGWASIEAALAENLTYGKNVRTVLTDFYRSIKLAGRKYIQIFDLPPELSTELCSSLKSATAAPSKFSSHYPYVLTDAELAGAPSVLTLCEVIPSGDDFLLVFCSRKDYTEKETFENAVAEAIGEQAPSLKGYSKIVGLKTKSFQAFDVVAIRPKLQRIEVMVDMPHGHIQDFDRFEQALKMRAAVTLHLPPLGNYLASKVATNLFPAIDAMYQSKDGGKIKELRLRTSTGLVDNLKTTVDTDDLRINKYHTDAAKAVNYEVALFDLTTTLALSFPPTHVTIRLRSNVTQIAVAPENRTLHGVEVIDGMSPSDIARSINKLQTFLG